LFDTDDEPFASGTLVTVVLLFISFVSYPV